MSFEVLFRRGIRFWLPEGPMRGPGRLEVGPEGLRMEGRTTVTPWLSWPVGAFMFWFLRTGLLLVWLAVQYGMLRRGAVGVEPAALRRAVRDPKSDNWRVEVDSAPPFHFRLRDRSQADRLEEALAEALGRPVERGRVVLDQPELWLGLLGLLLLVSLVGTLTLG